MVKTRRPTSEIKNSDYESNCSGCGERLIQIGRKSMWKLQGTTCQGGRGFWNNYLQEWSALCCPGPLLVAMHVDSDKEGS